MYEQMAMSGSPDLSMISLAMYMLLSVGGMIVVAFCVGLATLPVFFIVILLIELGLGFLADTTGMLVFKVPLILFRSLRRSPLRTSLSYLALFVFTFVLGMIYSVSNFIGIVTAEKDSNFKVIMTEKFSIPSLMPPGYEQRLKGLIAQMPKEMQPTNGEDDIIAWSFVGGTTDPSNPRPENAMFMFCVDPTKITTMMDGLEKKDLTDEEYALMQKYQQMMKEDPRRIILSKQRLEKMNLTVGQKLKLSGLNYKDITFEFEVIGLLPDGKYDGTAFCSREYLDRMLKSYENSHSGTRHPFSDRCVNLIWVRLPTRAAYETLAEMINDPKNFSGPAVKMETASAGIGSFLDVYKDIFFGIKYFVCPAILCIMSLVIANAISIGVRERRGEFAVLKVLGFRPWHVMALILGEALLVGMIAGFMSMFILCYGVGNVKFPIAFLGVFFVPKTLLLYGPILGIGVSLTGSIMPAISAKDIKVSDVFSKIA